MIEYLTNSSKETEEFASKIANTLKGKETIALFGDLGAGKTCFTRGLCDALNVNECVSSPTFAIVNVYNGKYKVYHFDMYRILSLDDLDSIGYYDYINNGITIIEWSENIEEVLDKDIIRIKITYGNHENQRLFTIEGLDEFENIIC